MGLKVVVDFSVINIVNDFGMVHQDWDTQSSRRAWDTHCWLSLLPIKNSVNSRTRDVCYREFIVVLVPLISKMEKGSSLKICMDLSRG